MGRDTGLTLMTREKFPEDTYERWDEFNVPEGLGKFYDETYNSNQKYNAYEICYWRKVNSIANFISNLVDYEEDLAAHANDEDWECEVSIGALKEIKDEIYNELCHPDQFESWIWSWEEYYKTLAMNLARITWLIGWLQEHTEDYCTFYDSY